MILGGKARLFKKITRNFSSQSVIFACFRRTRFLLLKKAYGDSKKGLNFGRIRDAHCKGPATDWAWVRERSLVSLVSVLLLGRNAALLRIFRISPGMFTSGPSQSKSHPAQTFSRFEGILLIGQI